MRARLSVGLRADAGWELTRVRALVPSLRGSNYAQRQETFLPLSSSQWHIGTVSMVVSGYLELLGCSGLGAGSRLMAILGTVLFSSSRAK